MVKFLDKIFCDTEGLLSIIPDKYLWSLERAQRGLRGERAGGRKVAYDVKRIESRVSYGCERLLHVVFSEGLRTIGQTCFCRCALSSVALPASVRELQGLSFYSCRLRTVTFCGSKPVCADSYVFGANDGLRREDVRFPDGSEVSDNAFAYVQCDEFLESDCEDATPP